MRAGAILMIRARRLVALSGVSVFLFVPFVHAANRPTPEVVNVKAFARLEGRQLELLVRVPLAAVKDVQFPTRGDAGYLDLDAVKSMLPGAARYWIAGNFEVLDRGVPLPRPEVDGTRISISSDQSFDAYQAALARFRAPDLPADEKVFWEQVWLDIRFRYSARSDRPAIAIDPKLAGLGVRVTTDLTYVEPDGDVRAFSFEGDPGVIYLDPRWTDAGQQFLARGARFVLRSADFLLFLFCLALPFRRYRPLLPAVVTFAGSLALALLAASFDLVPNATWFHPLIDTLAAAAILFAAFANIAGRVTPRRRALLALGAGFVFGCSCAFHLGAIRQFGGSHAVISTLAFGAGIVVAIAGAVALGVPTLSFLFSLARVENLERIIVSALAADTAWGRFSERWAQLRRIPFQLAFDAGLLALTLRSLAALILFGGLIWFVNEWLKSHTFADDELTPARDRGTAA
jgi:HupE / UreJ protein